MTEHPSRRGWADPMIDEPAQPAGHSHRLPAGVKRAFMGLGIAVVLLSIAVAMLLYYVVGRGNYRDAEQTRIEQQIRQNTCDLLDQLPEGVLLDRPRAKYGCGPGLPPSSSPSGRLSGPGRPRAGAPAATPGRVPTPSTGAAPSTPPAPVTTTASSPPLTSRPPAPPSPGLLAPVTKPVCDALGVCL